MKLSATIPVLVCLLATAAYGSDTGIRTSTSHVYSRLEAVMSSQAPDMEFESTEYDFGTMEHKGEPQSTEFHFRNTGSAPLVIIRTELSCTCIAAEYPRKPVMPGQEGTIKVTYTPKQETGPFSNNVKIYTNSADRRPEILFVRGEVIK